MLRENDGRGATVGAAARTCPPTAMPWRESFRQFRDTDATPMLFTAVFLLIGLAGPGRAAEHASSFVATKSYPTLRAYELSKGSGMVEVGPASLQFIDKAGRSTKSVPLGVDSRGYESRAAWTGDGAVVVRSTGGYETSNFFLDFYKANGQQSGTIQAPTGEFAICPKGDCALVLGHHAKYLYRHSGQITVVDATGKPLQQHQIPSGMHPPRFVFSRSGTTGTIIYAVGRQDEKWVSGLLVFAADGGKLLGRSDSTDWIPLSQDVDNRTLSAVQPLARVDEASRLVVLAGQDAATLTQSIRAVSFDGPELWRQPSGLNPKSCGATLVLKEQSSSFVLAELCENSLSVAEYDSKTGTSIGRKVIPIAGVLTNFLRASISQSEHLILFSLRDPGGQGRAFALASDLSLGWQERFDSKLGGEAWFDLSGRVIIRNGQQIKVGAFR